MTLPGRLWLVATPVLAAAAVAVAATRAGVPSADPARTPASPPHEAAVQTPTDTPTDSLTSVPGIRVGHHTLAERPTGCTVILAPDRTVGGVDVAGGAPGTRETDLLEPENTVQHVNAIVLSGGSAFGLAAADGVMTWLAEHGIGYPITGGPVPIVPAAIIFDLPIGDHPEIRPTAACGYAAAGAATSAPVAQGSVGAGAGATIGKSFARGRGMKGGVGSAALRTEGGLIVAALVVVNAVGSVVDPRTGQPVAGVRTADGLGLENPWDLVRRGITPASPAGGNTTLGVVATNARLTKAEARKVARMAQDGFARAIVPSHTPSDGDTIFTLATGQFEGAASTSTVGSLAAEAITDAILRAVRLATGLPGYPAVADLRR
ncbi:MAG: P1 family peptidase [Vicinamibacterales bacterium]